MPTAGRRELRMTSRMAKKSSSKGAKGVTKRGAKKGRSERGERAVTKRHSAVAPKLGKLGRGDESLATYRAKRHFDVTPEPAPEATLSARKKRAEASARGEFVVQKHDATRLHYDVRIEIDGAMMSWAVPKGPSFDPAVKRLAVETEDHPMAYNAFEGRIPDGEYGAGDVLIWDRGTYETVPPGQERAMREKGHFHVRFFGEKLRGGFHFVRTGGRRKGDERPAKSQWLMFKANDEEANPARDVVTEAPGSVVSGRSATRGPRRVGASTSGKSARALLTMMGGVEQATLVKGAAAIGDPSKYRFEIKYDGYRVLAAKAGDDVRLLSRNGKDWTDAFPTVARAIAKLPVREAVLDGEVCAVAESGASSFHALQRWLSGDTGNGELSYAVFDLLWVDGRDLRERTLEERRELLEPLLDDAGAPLTLSTSIDATEQPLEAILGAVCARGLEGLIAKRKGSRYVVGRTRDWLKLKCGRRQELAVVGYVPLRSKSAAANRSRIGALLLGVAGEGGTLRYAGKVGTGFDDETRKELARALESRHVETPPVEGAPRMKVARWSRPGLVAEVSFTEWTADGKIRHPSFLGLREDKAPSDCRREEPATSPASAAAAPKRRRAKTTARRPAIATPHSIAKGSLAISNPDKVLFPRDGITKRQIVEYFVAVAPYMLPHLAGRPIALQRWPNGIDGQAWFQQRPPEKVPPFVSTIDVGDRRHLLVDNVETLAWLGNLGALTQHVWASHAPSGTRGKAAILRSLAQPDWVIFDLDPGEGAWADLVAVAHTLHDLLDDLGLPTVVKTSGKRGLHVLVPLAPGATYDAVTSFAGDVAARVAHVHRDVATVERMKAKRGGRLYVDYLQNGEGKTIVAPYTIRASDGAPVSTPLSWDEVTAKLDPRAFTIRTVLQRLARRADLFGAALEGTARLPADAGGARKRRAR